MLKTKPAAQSQRKAIPNKQADSVPSIDDKQRFRDWHPTEGLTRKKQELFDQWAAKKGKCTEEDIRSFEPSEYFSTTQVHQLYNELRRKDAKQMPTPMRERWQKANEQKGRGGQLKEKKQTLAITLISPKMEWDDVSVATSVQVSVVESRVASAVWKHIGQMEISHGKSIFVACSS